MKSTGEVMGVADTFPIAFAKSQIAAGTVLPSGGKVFISVTNRSKDHVADLARRLERLGFELLATRGTALRLEEAGIRVQTLKKVQEGHPNVVDYMIDGNLQLVINTPSGKGARTDEGRIAPPPFRTASPASRRSKAPRPPSAPWKRFARKR